MLSSTLTPLQLSVGQVALAVVLAVAGFYLLLPRPSRRRVGVGVAALLAAAAVFAAWLVTTFAGPMPDLVGSVLFGFFACGALGFATVLVTQRNPARGAIAFAFVILSTCGLFLLLAAPLLMAATIIVYAGAIVVTFLFVLMLSQTGGPSDENDRSREPLFGSLAGFAFTGLILFTLYLTQLGSTATAGDPAPVPPQRLPVTVLTASERKTLLDVVARLDAAPEALGADPAPPAAREPAAAYFDSIRNDLATVTGSIGQRLGPAGAMPDDPRAEPLRTDEQAAAVLRRVAAVREASENASQAALNHLFEGQPDRSTVIAELRKVRDEALLLSGSADLPARNTANLGYLLYTQHLLAIELAGTLLLIATIGAVVITQRKGVAA